MTRVFFWHQLEVTYWFVFKSPTLRVRVRKVIHSRSCYLITFNLLNPPIIIQRVERYMLKTSPKKYQNVLIPSYRKVFYRQTYCHWKANHSLYIAIGCRRILYDVGYLAALHRPNMTLRSNDIEAIVEDGIVTKDGIVFFCVSKILYLISCRRDIVL